MKVQQGAALLSFSFRLVLVIAALVGVVGQNAGDNRAKAGEPLEERFTATFLGRRFHVFVRGDYFSTLEQAQEICDRHALDPHTHLRALRELIENTVVRGLGHRIDDMWDEDGKKDVAARAVVDGVCREFAALHGMPESSRMVRRGARLRVIDAFPFFNELDILNIRLRELDPVVDKFVLVESARTHAGNPKNLVFEENLHRFEEWRDKIVHVVQEELPGGDDNWVRERAQRDAVHDGLQQAAVADHDIVLISDTDEIPRRSTVRALSWCEGYRAPLRLQSAFYYYSFRHRWMTENSTHPRPFPWNQPRAIIASQFRYPELTANSLRYDKSEGNMEVVQDASWHLSFFGGSKRILEKLEAYAHQENNKDQFKDEEHISKALQEGIDLFNRGAVHGVLKRNDEPYDLPSAVLEDIVSGYLSPWEQYLPLDFNIKMYTSNTQMDVCNEEMNSSVPCHDEEL